METWSEYKDSDFIGKAHLIQERGKYDSAIIWDGGKLWGT